jgi:hypothetical protein
MPKPRDGHVVMTSGPPELRTNDAGCYVVRQTHERKENRRKKVLARVWPSCTQSALLLARDDRYVGLVNMSPAREEM